MLSLSLNGILSDAIRDMVINSEKTAEIMYAVFLNTPVTSMAS
jgi:hypothetical protein